MSDRTADDVTLDEYGRIVIPKPLREALGVDSGSELVAVLEEDEDGTSLRLRPRRERPVVVRKEGHRVHTGRLTEEVDLVDVIKEQRLERAHRIAGLA